MLSELVNMFQTGSAVGVMSISKSEGNKAPLHPKHVIFTADHLHLNRLLMSPEMELVPYILGAQKKKCLLLC